MRGKQSLGKEKILKSQGRINNRYGMPEIRKKQYVYKEKEIIAMDEECNNRMRNKLSPLTKKEIITRE